VMDVKLDTSWSHTAYIQIKMIRVVHGFPTACREHKPTCRERSTK
jgi:hypothetical protein